MSCNWPLVSLADVTSKIGDGLHGTPKYDDNGEYFFINGNNLFNGSIIINESTKRTSEEEYLKHKKDLNDRTILVSINGTLGNIGTYQGEKVFLGKSACYLNILPEVDKDFIKYVLTGHDFQNYIHNLATGSTIKNVGLKLMREYEFKLPDHKTQKSISTVLSSIDLKINANTNINQTLEEMAQAIFKSWFVDFDPVKAKMNGEQPEGMDEATASLFPEKLVESELGLIPEGWAVGSLGDVAKYCSARTSIDSVTLENYISTENMLAEKKGVTAASKLPTAKMIASYKTGDILVSNIRPYFKKIWLAEGNGGRSNDVLGFESSAPNTDSFLMNLLYQDSFFEYMTRTSKGAKMPRGDKTAIMNWEMAVPPVELREAFSTIVDKFYKLIPQNRAQNETLESLRDTLLPKLLSGEVELITEDEVGR